MKEKRGTRMRVRVLLVAMMFLTAACGMRVSESRLAAARAGQRLSVGGAGSAGTGTDSAADATGAGAIYGDVPASVASYQGWKAAAESVGYKVVYERGFSPTETDFTADVVRMRQSGVKMVYLTAADVRPTSRMAKAMAQQNVKVDAFVSGGCVYDSHFVALAGAGGDRVYIT